MATARDINVKRRLQTQRRADQAVNNAEISETLADAKLPALPAPANHDHQSQAKPKRLQLRKQNRAVAKQIEGAYGVSAPVATILAARGAKPTAALKNYLANEFKRSTPNPRNLKNYDKLVDAIADTYKKGKPINIYADYDADGIMSAVGLALFLKEINAKVNVIIGHRETEGHGPNKEKIARAARNGGMLLFLDFGTTHGSHVKFALQRKLKVGIIDHHDAPSDVKNPQEKLPASAILVNPRQEGDRFGKVVPCTGILTWYVIAGLRDKIPEAQHIDPEKYLPFAAITAIADRVELQRQNRTIARQGMIELQKTDIPGLVALKEVANLGKDLSARKLGLHLIPLINAAGRVAHGKIVYDIFTQPTLRKARARADRLEDLNNRRREVQKAGTLHAEEQIRKLEKLPPVLMIKDPAYQLGVVGLISQSLTERYGLPSLVGGLDRDGNITFSARSPSHGGIDWGKVINNVIKKELGDDFLKGGGHPAAAGGTLKAEAWERFVEIVEREALRAKKGGKPPVVNADIDLKFEDLSFTLVREMRQKLGPFGDGNPSPVVRFKNLEILEIKPLSWGGLKLKLSDGNQHLYGLVDRDTAIPEISEGMRVNVGSEVGIREFRGKEELQLRLKTIAKCSTQKKK